MIIFSNNGWQCNEMEVGSYLIDQNSVGPKWWKFREMVKIWVKKNKKIKADKKWFYQKITKSSGLIVLSGKNNIGQNNTCLNFCWLNYLLVLSDKSFREVMKILGWRKFRLALFWPLRYLGEIKNIFTIFEGFSIDNV